EERVGGPSARAVDCAERAFVEFTAAPTRRGDADGDGPGHERCDPDRALRHALDEIRPSKRPRPRCVPGHRRRTAWTDTTRRAIARNERARPRGRVLVGTRGPRRWGGRAPPGRGRRAPRRAA